MLGRKALVVLSQLSGFMAEKSGESLFASTGVGKQKNLNHCCEVLFKYDLWSLAPQSPAGTGFGMGSGIRNQIGRLNCMPC